LASDLPGPIVNTATATYTNGIAPFNTSDTASSTATTDLFVPSVDVQKDCGPATVQVGETEVCHIHIQNTSGGTTPPALHNGTIVDSLDGNLLDAGNAAVVASTCSATLATGAFCDITTNRVVLASDTSPISDTVVVHYNPTGFPNDVSDSASANVVIVAPAITVTLDATPLSKPTDQVTYTITVCNTGPVPVSRNSVTGTVIGDETTLFPTTLAPGQCATVVLNRTVQANDPNPLIVTVTATYSGITQQATASSTDSTDLFYPGVDVTKSCSPDPISVGQVEACVINVSNTSTGTTPPALTNGTIVDSLSGNLLAAGNPAVTSNTCTTTLATGASCSITTARTVLASDVSPLVNTVVVHYNPDGFPNSIDDSASAQVTIQVLTQGCTPGFWKLAKHFTFWKVYTPNQTFSSAFGVSITLANGTVNPTLIQALNANGGGINTFARFAVNALLNSTALASPDLTTAQVIALVVDAVTPGGLTLAQVTTILQNLPGVTSDNCPIA
jgi:uncharacterized repeat protein (TIGR01451 family)